MELMNGKNDWAKVAEVELVYKPKIKASERPSVHNSTDSAQLLRTLWGDNKMCIQEEFKVLLLNRANRVLGVYEASSGSITGTVADPRLILAAAVKGLAVSLILAHNHPSGSITPSRADEELTQKIKEAARYFDIKILDHIIINAEGHYSFADEGLF